MSTPPDDYPPPVRVHRPAPADPSDPDEQPAPEKSWPFGGSPDTSDKPAVPVSPRVIGTVLLVLLVLFTTYLILPSVIRSSRGGGGGGGKATPSVSASASSTASATPSVTGSAPLPTTVAPTPVITPVADPGVAAPADDALQAWYDATGARLVTELDTLIGALQDDIDARDTVAVGDECGALGDLSDEALSNRPPGNEALVAASWDDAFDRVAASSDACVSATQSGDDTALRSALAQARQALVFAQQAVDQAERAL